LNGGGHFFSKESQMPMPQVYSERDPDKNVVAVFKQVSVPNQGKSKEQNRPIFDDVDVCEIRYPGSRNTGVYPAEGFSHWATDFETGEQIKVSYAERFPRQYRQFKERSVQTKSGTPLEYALFLTEARRAELRALNIYTIEALSVVDGQELKNLGPHGRDAKNKAIEYLEEASRVRLQAQLEVANQRNAMLEEDIKVLKSKNAVAVEAIMQEGIAAGAEGDFDSMTMDQLRGFIEANSGHAPVGSVNRKTLLRMAEACKPVSNVA
jgi:hypothetical protein